MTPARQLAGTMRLSGAMVRKYAQAYEAITKDRIAIIGRDGRQFTGPQRDALLRAKAFLDENPGMSVDQAMRAALGRVEIAAKRPGGALDAEALAEIAAPLQAELAGIREGLAELPELRREVAALRLELERTREPGAIPQRLGRPKAFADGRRLEDTADESDRERTGSRDGFLVRAARRIESLILKK